MIPDLSPPGSVRPAAVVNEEIRALLSRAGGQLADVQRREYEQLLAEWGEAVRGEVAEAA